MLIIFIVLIINQQMGNNWGIIHNQTKEELSYMLHHQELTPQEAQITKELGAGLQVKLDGPEAELKVAYGSNITSLKKKVQCVYSLKPGRITTVGLDNIDFDKIKFITISAKGKNLITSGKISESKHLRLRIQDDFTVTRISDDKADKLKNLTQGVTGENGKCPACNNDNVADSKDFEEKKKCCECGAKHYEVWICRKMPIQHTYCPECYDLGFKQKVDWQ